jgi:hypothetical protein
MTDRITFHQTNITFNNHFIEKLAENPGRDVLIIIGGGAHPEGYYLAPYNLIAKLVLAKKELPCWKNYGCWTQSNIPKPLREFFHHDQENK